MTERAKEPKEKIPKTNYWKKMKTVGIVRSAAIKEQLCIVFENVMNDAKERKSQEKAWRRKRDEEKKKQNQRTKDSH